MYRRPSTSNTYGPSARATRYGMPPTDLNARIDELTPPGIARAERSNSVALEGMPAPWHSTGSHPAAAQATASHGVITGGPVSSSDGLGEPPGEVREDHVGAGTADRRQLLERHGVVVDPPVGRGRLQHRVLAADVVRGERYVDQPTGGGDDVEVGDGGLHHHHVG